MVANPGGTFTLIRVCANGPTTSALVLPNFTVVGGQLKLSPFSSMVSPAMPLSGEKGGTANVGGMPTRAARNVSSLTTLPPAVTTVIFTSTKLLPVGTTSSGTTACSTVAEGVP